MDRAAGFERYKNRKIALYGLGTETEKALHEMGGCYEIAGLLDSFQTEGEIFGRPIISFDDAVRAGIGLVIVVARPGSCRAIAGRIGGRCRKEGIALMDIRGKDLLETKAASCCLKDTEGVTKAALREKIGKAAVVSFDLFDTLVMRRTLLADDVAGYVDCRLKQKGICIDDFCRRRIAGEKELAKNAPSALAGIYQYMLEKTADASGISVTAQELADLEWEIDLSLLVPRKEVCDIFREAAAKGKKVYVVSDTYYSRGQLSQILSEKCGIVEYADILSSSDCGTDKKRDLFRVLADREGSVSAGQFLHIGDDLVADLESAQRHGLDAIRLLSGVELLDEAGGMGLSGCVESLSDRLKAGMFVARLFNSPFQFENEDRHIEVSDVYDVGYLFCAPVISDFMLWFREHMEQGQLRNIWFSARDGYLPWKMYAHLMRTSGQEDRSVYFLTSRTAAVRAGVCGMEDIRYVETMRFSGTLEENLKERFGICADAMGRNGDPREKGLMQYRDLILERAKKAREGYKKYIGRLQMEEGAAAFFDLVAKGTTQMFVQRLTDTHLKGFYFLRLEKEQMRDKQLDIASFYENGETGACAVYNSYYILETLLTAPHPSVQGFDDAGEPVYAVETRTERDIQCLARAQEGIFAHFQAYLELCPKAEQTVNRKLDEVLLKLLHKVRITDRDFLGTTVEDPFFNRMTKIADIL